MIKYKQVINSSEFNNGNIKLPPYVDSVVSVKSNKWQLLKYTFDTKIKDLKIFHALGLYERIEIHYYSIQLDRESKINKLLNE